MNQIILEDTKKQLIQKSKNADNYALNNQQKGKNRFERRLHSRVASSVRDYNSINMDNLFKKDLFTINIHVMGETDDYLVRISFKGFLETLRNILRKYQKDEIDLKLISRALIETFDKDDVYISCSCPDWHYRFGYWATKNKISSGPDELRPSDITNPNDTKGAACKHVLLVLNNNTWMIKVASVIKNYIEYIKNHYEKMYADIIYPAIYDKKYEKDVQLDIFDNDKLAIDKDTDEIDKANIEARKKGQFQKGNKFGVRFAPEEKTKQLDFDKIDQEN